jgi:NTP pyrophosphatase (non-canonical NTP hydrolase)
MVRHDSIQELQETLRQFASDRNWEQFHSPKNLAMALSVEAGELLEQFQWKSESESKNLRPEERVLVGQEAADVFLYLIRLADLLNIDLIDAAREKLLVNADKYPVEKSFGSSKKYTEL